jgi:DNA invertase Pin-like site-specific DNA recombinase
MLTKGRNDMTSNHEPTSKVAIYCRVVTPEQAESQPERAAIYARSATPNREAIDQQIAEGCQHCAEHGYTLDDQHIYPEIIGGKRENNHSYLPQLDALRRAAKNHKFDVLVIRSLDRLARDIQFQTMILNELAQAGTRVECTGGPDPDDDQTKLVEAVIEQVGHIERQQIIKHMQYGKAAKKAQREQ